MFALLGDNGAGKTTAIKAMMGMTPIDSGDITVLGLSPASDDLEIRRRVGFVPEQPMFYDWMTVEDAGWFVSGLHPAGALERFREQMKAFDVPLNKKIRNLSKGMRSKCSLGLALCHDPELLILDEPTSGLDPLVRREFLESMVDRASQGRTVLLASHQVEEVERVADHVAVIREGRLLHAGPLDSLKQQLQMLEVHVAETGSPAPPVACSVIHQQQRGRQWELLVDGMSDEQFAELSQLDFVDRCEARRPTLEEIVLGFLRSSEEAAA